MVSTKLSKKEQDEYASACGIASPDAPVYPYGTELRLEDELLTKLGIATLPPVGTKFALIGVCEVVDTAAREDKSGKENCLSLQVTDMQIDAVEKSNDERASKLWPASK